MKNRAASLVAIAVVGSALAAGTNAAGVLLKHLTTSRPDIRWDASSEITGDFDGDGKHDSAIVGYGTGNVILAVMASSGVGGVQYLEFPLAQTQEGICSAPVKLSTSVLVCVTDGGAKLPGCLASKGAIQLSLNDGNCDPINFYWDHDKHRLVWWRN